MQQRLKMTFLHSNATHLFDLSELISFSTNGKFIILSPIKLWNLLASVVKTDPDFQKIVFGPQMTVYRFNNIDNEEACRLKEELLKELKIPFSGPLMDDLNIEQMDSDNISQ